MATEDAYAVEYGVIADEVRGLESCLDPRLHPSMNFGDGSGYPETQRSGSVANKPYLGDPAHRYLVSVIDYRVVSINRRRKASTSLKSIPNPLRS